MLKRKKGSFDFVNNLIMLFVAVIMLYPFLYILSLSLSNNEAVLKGSITFYPQGA
jgi:putative aldouronate transport system permease protein